MLPVDDVVAMMRLRRFDWGKRRIERDITRYGHDP